MTPMELGQVCFQGKKKLMCQSINTVRPCTNNRATLPSLRWRQFSGLIWQLFSS
ncbi:hypothetical protein Tsubulata_011808 [Turnera subulata]|uniref:Uncharacterized protein n=1 Tax=Turnera subulata TaxID=218843 RepID=A0A9Q0FST0_9ROSI|nr:hypothetical protein Tsubulata_011808 [Turnera subulata]